MSRNVPKRTRPVTNVAIGLLLALLFVGGALLAMPAPAATSRTSTGLPGNAHLGTSVIATTTIYLNKSHVGTYYPEYVTLNNSSTLTRLPATLTVVASTCRWVTVANVTTAVDAFHKDLYNNVTSANASGTVLAGPAVSSFKVCGGSAAWVNYKLWTYGRYIFTAVGLPINATLTARYNAYPSSSATPTKTAVNFSKLAVVSLLIPSNLTFFVLFPLSVTGATTCTNFAQTCSFQIYSFLSATNGAGTLTNKSGNLTFGSGKFSPLASATWSNWTVLYTNATVWANTSTGAFLAFFGSFWTTYFVNWAAAWIFAIVLIVVVSGIYAAMRHSRRERQR